MDTETNITSLKGIYKASIFEWVYLEEGKWEWESGMKEGNKTGEGPA